MIAYTSMRPSQGFGGTGEKGQLFQGNRGTNVKFEGSGGTKTILRNREHKNQIFDFWGTSQIISGEQGNRYPLGGLLTVYARPPHCIRQHERLKIACFIWFVNRFAAMLTT